MAQNQAQDQAGGGSEKPTERMMNPTEVRHIQEASHAIVDLFVGRAAALNPEDGVFVGGENGDVPMPMVSFGAVTGILNRKTGQQVDINLVVVAAVGKEACEFLKEVPKLFASCQDTRRAAIKALEDTLIRLAKENQA